MYCSTCGTVVRGLNHCSSCGHETERPSKKQTKPIKWIITSLVFSVIMVIAIGLLYFFVIHDNQVTLDARLMSVFRVDGDTISLQSAGGVRTDARSGMGLHAGYTVSTGFNSFCYISLDAYSIVKMDTTTDITIAQLTDRLLRINIDRGQVLVDLQWQPPDHELEAIIGNTVISVRGTKFVAGVYAGGEAIISVLGGSIYVNYVPLEAGYTMRVFDGIEMIYEVGPINFELADDFLLNAAGIMIDDDAQLSSQEAFVYDEDIVIYPEELELEETNEDDVLPILNFTTLGLINNTLGEVIEILGPYTWSMFGGQDSNNIIFWEYYFGTYHFMFEYQYGRQLQSVWPDEMPLSALPREIFISLSSIIGISETETVDAETLHLIFSDAQSIYGFDDLLMYVFDDFSILIRGLQESNLINGAAVVHIRSMR